MDDVSTRAAIADAITTDLEQMGQEETPPTPAPDPIAAEETAPTTPEPEQVAPTEGEPAPVELSDKSLVLDPATGEKRTWGEIKAERLRFADYTKKTQSLAEMRRSTEAAEAQRAAEYEAWRTQQIAAQLPELPEDDPYAQRIAAVEAQARAVQAAYQSQVAAAEAERFAAANTRLEAEVARAAEEYKLNPVEQDIVGRETLAAMQQGKQVTYADLAKQFVTYRDGLKAAAVQEWQNKHRVSAPAAAVSAPAPGVATEIPAQGTRGFADRIREEIASMMGA